MSKGFWLCWLILMGACSYVVGGWTMVAMVGCGAGLGWCAAVVQTEATDG